MAVASSANTLRCPAKFDPRKTLDHPVLSSQRGKSVTARPDAGVVSCHLGSKCEAAFKRLQQASSVNSRAATAWLPYPTGEIGCRIFGLKV
jgi:hypothetical protein